VSRPSTTSGASQLSVTPDGKGKLSGGRSANRVSLLLRSTTASNAAPAGVGSASGSPTNASSLQGVLFKKFAASPRSAARVRVSSLVDQRRRATPTYLTASAHGLASIAEEPEDESASAFAFELAAPSGSLSLDSSLNLPPAPAVPGGGMRSSAPSPRLSAPTKLVFDDVDNIYVLEQSASGNKIAAAAAASAAATAAAATASSSVAAPAVVVTHCDESTESDTVSDSTRSSSHAGSYDSTVGDEQGAADIVIRLPIYDGEFAIIRPDLSSNEPMTPDELAELRTRACSFYHSHVYDRTLPAGTGKSSLDVEPATARAGLFDRFERSVVLRIAGHADPLALVALAATCHRMRHFCRALVRARYCNQRRLPLKTHLARQDYWRITLETEMLQQATLADFEWHKTLGTGSFGRVRLVRFARTGQFYAMKCLKKAMLLEHEQQDRLYWEKDIVATLEHPFVVQFYRTFQDRVYVYFLFEFAGGGEVFRLICEHGRLQARVVKFYAAQTLLVLKYFAALNIVYRDIKPENLLLSADGNIKFTDFGFAAVLPAGEKSTAFLASAEYIAPEMILGKGYDGAVDMWSFGVLLYELLVGMPPFVGALPDISYNIFNTPVDFPVRIDADAKDLIGRLLVLDPAARLTPEQAMRHKWFDGVNWHMVYTRMYPPPYAPPVRSRGDTSQFNEYREEEPDALEEVAVDFEEFC
jgi:hypothetical protein